MDVKHNQRKQGFSRSWTMQPYWENDVTSAVDKALIDSAQGSRGMLLHTVLSNLPSLPLITHHTTHTRLLLQVKPL